MDNRPCISSQSVNLKKGDKLSWSSGEIFRTLFGVDLYIRIHGSDPAVQEHIILEYVRAHGQVSRDKLAKTLIITRDQSRRIIERMVRSGVLQAVKKSPRRLMYVLADRE